MQSKRSHISQVVVLQRWSHVTVQHGCNCPVTFVLLCRPIYSIRIHSFVWFTFVSNIAKELYEVNTYPLSVLAIASTQNELAMGATLLGLGMRLFTRWHTSHVLK